ncbi:MAG: hypothetical protein JEZ09_00635 [Salinivirgaceae bacterium]|nr:hypothetical protein [Salinivirgaceae bacterium]
MSLEKRHILLVLIIPLIVLFQFWQSNFRHSHTIENGIVVEHSHPSKSSNSSPFSTNHHHSKSEFISIAGFSANFTNIQSVVCLNDITIPCIEIKKEVDYKADIPFKHYLSILFRGPPSL